MKKLEVSQPTVELLFTEHNNVFSIPFYQRPYSWEEEQCAELWDDVNNFAFPNGHTNKFNPDDNFYYLGNVVTYRNDNRLFEVVDGQQRIISLLLLMRALYEELRETENGRQLGKCIWHFTENLIPDVTRPRIESHAIMDWDKDKIKQILASGEVTKNDKSKYANNYRFFRNKIVRFKSQTPDNLESLAGRLLRNIYVTRMEANSEEQALQLFLTINDRGMALRVEDIFQAKLYEEAKINQGDEAANIFLVEWQKLGERCAKLFSPEKGLTPIEFIFLLYAETQRDYVNWKQLKAVYSANDYSLLKSKKTLKDINLLIAFFGDLYDTNDRLINMGVSDSIARKAHIMFRINKNATHHLLAQYYFKRLTVEDVYGEQLDTFLDICIANFVRAAVLSDGYSYARQQSGLQNATDFINGRIPEDLKVAAQTVKWNFEHFYELKSFDRAHPIIVKWWTFQNENQPRIDWKTSLQTEHICPKAVATQRQFGNPYNVELPGNLALLESKLNKKASAKSFVDKCTHYSASKNTELKQLAEEQSDFSEDEIKMRNQKICRAVIDLLDKNGFLLK